jgi:putative methylase
LQRRLVRKLDLEKAIAQIAPHPSPKAYLEQYTISPEAAAEILFTATYIYNDICSKRVLDLGCGTGRLAIAAALLGAKEVVGVDIDKIAIRQAAMNAEKLGVKTKTSWIITDIGTIRGSFDTVLQNPPYGVQKRGADLKFLEKALQIGRRVYSLHKSVKTIGKQKLVPSPFLERFIEENGGEIEAISFLLIKIPHMFAFHQKRVHRFPVNLYVIERKNKRFIEQQKGKVSSRSDVC